MVLGNVGASEDAELLARALDDEEPIVREHAAWALGKIGSSVAAAALRANLDAEEVAAVRAEIASATAATDRFEAR